MLYFTAFVIKEGGNIEIKRVNLDQGMEVQKIHFDSKYCNKHSGSQACYYNLSHTKDEIMGDGNIIVRLAGCTVKEVITTKKGEKVKLIPVGITLSIPKSSFDPALFELEKEVKISLGLGASKSEWDNVNYAVEAGPMLVVDGKKTIGTNFCSRRRKFNRSFLRVQFPRGTRAARSRCRLRRCRRSRPPRGGRSSQTPS